MCYCPHAPFLLSPFPVSLLDACREHSRAHTHRAPFWGPRGLSGAALALLTALLAPLFHAEHLPRPRPLQRPCRGQGIRPVAGEEQVRAGGAAWGGVCIPSFPSPGLVSLNLSPERFIPSLPNPPGGVGWSQSPPALPQNGAAADGPSPRRRALLGQNYTETHYSPDGSETTEKPDPQVRAGPGGSGFASAGAAPQLCPLSLGRITASTRAVCGVTPARQRASAPAEGSGRAPIPEALLLTGGQQPAPAHGTGSRRD